MFNEILTLKLEHRIKSVRCSFQVTADDLPCDHTFPCDQFLIHLLKHITTPLRCKSFITELEGGCDKVIVTGLQFSQHIKEYHKGEDERVASLHFNSKSKSIGSRLKKEFIVTGKLPSIMKNWIVRLMDRNNDTKLKQSINEKIRNRMVLYEELLADVEDGNAFGIPFGSETPVGFKSMKTPLLGKRPRADENQQQMDVYFDSSQKISKLDEDSTMDSVSEKQLSVKPMTFDEIDDIEKRLLQVTLANQLMEIHESDSSLGTDPFHDKLDKFLTASLGAEVDPLLTLEQKLMTMKEHVLEIEQFIPLKGAIDFKEPTLKNVDINLQPHLLQDFIDRLIVRYQA